MKTPATGSNENPATDPAPADNTVTAPARKRKTADRRWSASSTVEWLDTDRRTIRRDADASNPPRGAVKARVHYRVKGATKRPVFDVSTSLDDIQSFIATLNLAYLENWPADRYGRPERPVALEALTSTKISASQPVPVFEPIAHTNLADLANPGDTGTSPAGATQRLDLVALIKIYRVHQRTTPKKKGGGSRTRKTHCDYTGHQEFILTHGRYAHGDPRPSILGLKPGDPWVMNDPRAPLRKDDVLALITARATTNLRTRAVNERRLAAWRKAVEKAHRANPDDPELPPIPELVPEAVSGRTVEAFGQQLGALLTYAYKRRYIPENLWTDDVNDEVPSAGTTSYTTKTVPSREEVHQLVTDIASTIRTYRDRNTGQLVTVNGERYAAMLWLAGRMAPRPEETIAIRAPWVILDEEDPRIELHNAEIVQPKLDDSPRERVVSTLKQRSEGVSRTIRPDPRDRDEFIAVMQQHLEKFVDDPDDEEQYFFTTESGRPVDLDGFNRNWWKPVRDTAFGEHKHFSDLPFRRLRAAAITDWLAVLGWTTREAAEMAGNSQAVIEEHYAGVLSGRKQRLAKAATRVSETSDVPVSKLNAEQITAEDTRLQAEIAALTARHKAVVLERLNRMEDPNG